MFSGKFRLCSLSLGAFTDMRWWFPCLRLSTCYSTTLFISLVSSPVNCSFLQLLRCLLFFEHRNIKMIVQLLLICVLFYARKLGRNLNVAKQRCTRILFLSCISCCFFSHARTRQETGVQGLKYKISCKKFCQKQVFCFMW